MIVNKSVLEFSFCSVHVEKASFGAWMYTVRRSLCVWCGRVLRTCVCWEFIVHLEGLNFLLCCDCCSFSFGFLVVCLWGCQGLAPRRCPLPQGRVSGAACCCPRKPRRLPWSPPSLEPRLPSVLEWLLLPEERIPFLDLCLQLSPASLHTRLRLTLVPWAPLPATCQRFLMWKAEKCEKY